MLKWPTGISISAKIAQKKTPLKERREWQMIQYGAKKNLSATGLKLQNSEPKAESLTQKQ